MLLTEIEEKEISRYIERYDFRKFVQGKTFLITGSNGICGSGIVKWLLYLNQNYRTSSYIYASTRNPNVKPEYIEDEDRIKYIEFGKEKEECCDLKIDYIIHLASPTCGKIFKSKPIESLKVIIEGTERTLEIAKEKKSEIIYLSSEEVYGTPNCDSSLDETYVGSIDSLNTRSCYPLGKKIAELLCKSYFEEYGVKTKIIRPTVILGLWQPYDSVKIEAEILRCILEQKNLLLHTDGLTKKSAIYSLDAIAAIFTVLFKGEPGEAYNATNPETFCSIKECAHSMFKKFNWKGDIVTHNQDDYVSSVFLPKRSLLEDISKIKSLGWEPLADMEHIFEIDIKRFKEKE